MIITTDDIFRNESNKLKSLDKSLSVENAPTDLVTGIVVRLGFNLDVKILRKFKNLKFVATITTGLDHIDQDFCHKHNIQLISLKGEVEFLNTITATPEHTWGLLLSLVRQIPAANQSVASGQWDRQSFFGNELAYKKIGIIGYGRVGKIIAEYAMAFRMQVSFYDPYIESSNHKDIEKFTLEHILENSDIISLHPPLNKSTEHLINKEHFAKMKKSPFLVNTARGKIILEKDLLWALENKKISGAAIDVLEHETDFVDKKIQSPLLEYMTKNTNLIITPHIAGSTYESMKRTALFIEEKILTLGL